MDLEECLNLGLAIAENRHDDFKTAVIKKVIAKIQNGGSELKKSLATGAISMADVVRCIKSQRCLRTPERDFGATYLEQIIGIAIREVIPVRHINATREIFGLDKLPPSELVQPKKGMLQKQIR